MFKMSSSSTWTLYDERGTQVPEGTGTVEDDERGNFAEHAGRDRFDEIKDTDDTLEVTKKVQPSDF